MLTRLLSHCRFKRPAQLNATALKRSAKLNRLLERERARADRSGQELSMILLGVDAQSSKSADDLSKLFETVEQRCRITDEVGVFDRRTVCVMLPDTIASGARHFADSVQAILQRQGIQTSYAIYSYGPTDRKPPNDEGGGSRRHDDTPAEMNRRAHHRETPREAAMPVAGHAFDLTPTHELKDALVHRLPLWKRTIDLIVAGGILVVLWPLLVTIGIAIKVESRGPAVFRQQRSGLGGRPFEILKFRTMCDGAEKQRDALLHINEHQGPAFKIKRDPRITRLGQLLRKTSLDELPQLVNVIRGEMTLVGPRPLPVYESEECEDWQQRRLDVTPGLTCIWQISGRSNINFDEWVRMDLAYQRRRTLWHDLRILLATVPAVLTQRGAH